MKPVLTRPIDAEVTIELLQPMLGPDDADWIAVPLGGACHVDGSLISEVLLFLSASLAAAVGPLVVGDRLRVRGVVLSEGGSSLGLDVAAATLLERATCCQPLGREFCRAQWYRPTLRCRRAE
jgi:hypothetical protein